ncbi:MAG TPA: class I SAM-dependent methyltransferase [Pyrinomonadaceae bacterium]|nr:class I SAM-dependent methyltransferase [Pyrinomonadaceae bacterium]
MSNATRPASVGLPKEMQEHHYSLVYEEEEKHWWYVGRRRILDTFVRALRPKLSTNPPRILDVGCGTGANLNMLSNYGDGEGVDVSTQALNYCRERGLQNVKYGTAEELPFADASFDLVTALDVVEHLDDDLAGLREIRRVLKPGGFALLTVPAFMFLWGVQDDVSNHRRRYTMPQLKRVVTEAGFSIERATYANIMFFLPVLAVRTFMRLFGLRAQAEYAINVPVLNNFFAWLFALERFWLKRWSLPFGVSAFCVARRVE